MGGDNVLLHLCVEGDVMKLFNSAADFVGNFLCDCRLWSKDSNMPYERGAWIRCYGVPLHAWNDIFFLELASTRGRLLKIDDATVKKEKMDYARFLIATSDLKELNYVVHFLIDGKVYPIRFIEDLEFAFADDACLTEFEDDKSLSSIPECIHEDEPLVDALVQHMQDDLARHENEVQEVNVYDTNTSLQGKVDLCVVKENSEDSTTKSMTETALEKRNIGVCKVSKKNRVSKRPKVVPSLISLKKIARLSEADRNGLIRSLKKSKGSKRNSVKGKSSKSSSCNKIGASLSAGSGPSANSKDWENWVALHGDAKVVEDDIIAVGESIGIQCNNSFQVLSRGGVRGGAAGVGEVRVSEARVV